MRYAALVGVVGCGLVWGSLAAEAKGAPPAESRVSTAALRPLPDEAVRQNARLGAALSASARNKVTAAAAGLTALAKQQPGMTAAQLQEKARASVVQAFPKLNGMDVDALAFLVVMQSAQDQQADLQQMMQSMQQATKGKQGSRATQGGSLDQTNEMSEEESMRLQMAMDRQSKFYNVLSNVMKKVADTQASIVSNLK
jgi:hypothetical protein